MANTSCMLISNIKRKDGGGKAKVGNLIIWLCQEYDQKYEKKNLQHGTTSLQLLFIFFSLFTISEIETGHKQEEWNKVPVFRIHDC